MANAPESGAPVAGIILAAGLGRRMRETKVLLPWRGRPLVRHLAEVALASRLDEVLVVVGHQADEVAAAVADLPVRVVLNPRYAHGQSTSLSAGVAALPGHVAGALIVLADQPLLTTAVIDAIVGAFRSSAAPIVAACAGDRRGNPVLFVRALFPELLAGSGDEGARRVIAAHREHLHCVEVDAAIFEDVDTPEAYAALQQAGY